MNSKRIAFGIILVLAAFATPVMAGPNTVFFTNQSGSAEVGGITYVELWFNLTDSNGTHLEYALAGLSVNITYDPSIGKITAVDRMDGDPWNYEWFSQDHIGSGALWNTSWFIVAECDPWDEEHGFPDDPPYGLSDPGLYPVANITIVGISSGEMDLNFSLENPRECLMLDAIAEDWPEQVWENGTFACTGAAETFATSLAPGWNLISLPLTPSDSSTSAVLGNDDCTIVYGEVYSYDASTNLFVDVTTGTMETGVGYFVDVTTAGTWSYDGFADESLNSELSQGLNCIGWTNTGADLPGALDSIAGDYRYVSRWNAAEQKYELYDPVGETEGPEFIDFTTMERGVGYFIAATDSCTLTYP